MNPDFEWVINNGGIDSAADYPYTASQGTCNYNKVNHKVVTIYGYQDVAEEESALLCAVAQPGADLEFYANQLNLFQKKECSSFSKNGNRSMGKFTIMGRKKLENFKRNVKYIVEKNSKRKSDSDHLVGLNNFADMSNEEFRQVHTSKIKMPFNQKNKTISANSCVAPPSKDWRKHGVVTEVKNQGACGCCWEFSVSGAIEGINALVTGKLISLSTQKLVNCDTSNKGCEGRLMDPAFEFVISNGGFDSAADYPYTEYQRTCSYKKLNKKAVLIDGYQDVAQEESALLCAVATQPVSVGIDGKNLDFQLYARGIYYGECSSNPDELSHAVLIVGYGSEGWVDYWIIKNSWGKSWGMEGYAYIKRNTSLPFGVCAINSLASYPTKELYSTPPSPLVPPPPSPKPNICEDGLYYCPEVHRCCPIENGVCCENSKLCWPQDFPYCDVLQGLCHKDYGDKIGVAARKRTMAKFKLPWSSGTKEIEEMDRTLQWKRNQFAAMR